MPTTDLSLEQSDREDDTVLALMVAGDEQALALLMRKHWRMVLSILHQILGSLAREQDLEEIASDTFLAAWERSATYDTGRGTVRQWLRAITLYQGLTHRRSLLSVLRLRERLFEVEGAKPPMGRDTEFEDRLVSVDGLTVALAQLRRELTPTILRPFEMYYLQDVSVRDIARSLNITEPTTRVRIHRAVAQLRQLVQAKEEKSTNEG